MTEFRHHLALVGGVESDVILSSCLHALGVARKMRVANHLAESKAEIVQRLELLLEERTS